MRERSQDMSLDRQPFLQGELLELRPLRADDFEALFRAAADPLIWEQHPESNRYQEETFGAFFKEALASGGALVALDRTTGHIIGSSRYHGYDAERGVVEIGWTFLARAYWGGRYNGEMKRLMLEHAFKSVKHVIFVIGPENRRSQRAVEKIGGVRAGATTDAHGQERVVYELTPALYAQREGRGTNTTEGEFMELGAFSVSLAVKDIEASKNFYEKLGFVIFAGNQSQNWLIMKNGDHVIGLFQGMFEKNILTFNPGWSQDAQPLGKFMDVRKLQRKLKERGISLLTEADEGSTGPASFMIADPDGNTILVDQHV